MNDTPNPKPARRRKPAVTLIPAAPAAPVGPPGLADRIGQLADGVDGLRRAVDEERAVRAAEIEATVHKLETASRARRRSNLALGVAVAAALLGTLMSGWLAVRSLREADARESVRVGAAVITCENGNVTRQAILDVFDVYTTTLANLQASPTPEAEATKIALIAKLRSDFNVNIPPVLRAGDCSPAAVTKPTTISG